MKYNRTEKAIDVLPELDREYFNIQSLKSAVWQYMIDHAQFIRKDLLLVKFFIPNNVVFWDRVWARKEGKFLRNQMKQFNDEGQEILDHVKRLEQNERDSNIVNEAWNKILNEGKLHERILGKISIWIVRFGKRIKGNILRKHKII